MDAGGNKFIAFRGQLSDHDRLAQGKFQFRRLWRKSGIDLAVPKLLAQIGQHDRSRDPGQKDERQNPRAVTGE